ncbi:GtrA family protein [Brucella anthropi]
MLEAIRFLFVGGTGAALYLVGSILLSRAGLSPQTSSVISYSILIPIMYTAQRVLTFRSNEPLIASFLKYSMTQMASLVTSYILPVLFLHYVAAPAYFSFGLVLLVTATLNYGLLKFWAFRKKCND